MGSEEIRMYIESVNTGVTEPCSHIVIRMNCISFPLEATITLFLGEKEYT